MDNEGNCTRGRCRRGVLRPREQKTKRQRKSVSRRRSEAAASRLASGAGIDAAAAADGPAARAVELGLINRAVPKDQLDAAVGEVLADLRKGGPTAVGLAKALVYDVPAMEQKDAFAYTARLSGELFRGEEAKEGMAAFLGKRKAAWAQESEE